MNHPLLRLVKPLTAMTAALVALSLTACNAQTPAPSVRSTQSQAQPQADEPRTYSEPALIGKVIDQTTLKPIAGAFVYGHYMTTGGTLAGGSVAQDYVRNFVVETDSEGVFKLEAWNTGERKIAGIAGNRFPMVAIWKPGYEPEFLGLASIAQYQPRVRLKTSVGADGRLWVTDPYGKTYRYEKTEPDTTTIPNTLDWRATGFMLNPVKEELARYNALANSGRAMVMFGECGWEPYAKVLLAQHVELKVMIRQYVDAKNIDGNGYVRSGYFHAIPQADYINRSFVDRLKKQYDNSPTAWKCADLKSKFGETK